MYHPDALPIKEAIEKILESYIPYCPDDMTFRVTTGSSNLNTVNVLNALLQHAIDPSSVASSIWDVLKPYFQNVLDQRHHPEHVLFPPKDGWHVVNTTLMTMSEGRLEDLTDKLKTHAKDWITLFLLPIRSRGKLPGQLKSKGTTHKRIIKFREQLLEREQYTCPVTRLKDEAAPETEDEDEDDPRIVLEAAHILPFSIGDTKALVWDYIRMFTGDDSIADIVKENINSVENGILLQTDVHRAFGTLGWGIETEEENGVYKYYIKRFRKKIQFFRPGVGDGTELHFSTASGHKPPSPALCALHLKVCTVAHACSAAGVFHDLFKHDPDIIGRVAGSSELPTDPTLDDFMISYLERRLFEESAYIPPA